MTSPMKILGVISFGGKIVCYGERPVYHDTVGAGGTFIQKGVRFAAIEFGTSNEVPMGPELRDAIAKDRAKQAPKGVICGE